MPRRDNRCLVRGNPRGIDGRQFRLARRFVAIGGVYLIGRNADLPQQRQASGGSGSKNEPHRA